MTTQTGRIGDIQRNHGLVRLPENTQGRDFFIGDIHGQYDSLMRALESVGFNGEVDRLISVGDLIDRGPDSLKCLELLYEPWFHAVLGNHESFFAGAFLEDNDDDIGGLLGNGGNWIIHEDEAELRILAADVVAHLPLALEVPFKGHRLGVIHAAVTSGSWGLFDTEADIWNRRIMKPLGDGSEPLPPEATVKGIDVVVVGHNVVGRPAIRGNTLNLDCGAARGNEVTVWSAEDVLGFAHVHQISHQPESIAQDNPSAEDFLSEVLSERGEDDSLHDVTPDHQN